MKQKQTTSTIILYAQHDDQNFKRLSGRLKKFLASTRLIHLNSLGELEPMLAGLDKGNTLLVLMIFSKDIDGALVEMKKKGLFYDMRLILILPDTEGPVMHTAMKLAPSYITHLESDFEDIITVMIKMGILQA